MSSRGVSAASPWRQPLATHGVSPWPVAILAQAISHENLEYRCTIFAALTPGTRGPTLPDYKSWLARVAQNEFADEIIMAAVALRLGRRAAPQRGALRGGSHPKTCRKEQGTVSHETNAPKAPLSFTGCSQCEADTRRVREGQALR